MDHSTMGAAPRHQPARHQRPPTRPGTGSPGEDPDPTVVIEIRVDARPGAAGTWSVTLTPAIPALRPKHRTGLGSLAAVEAEVERILEALTYGGFPVATTWTHDGQAQR